jgi:hypothetical protein
VLIHRDDDSEVAEESMNFGTPPPPPDESTPYRPFPSETEAKLFIRFFGCERPISFNMLKTVWKTYADLDCIGTLLI